MYFESPTMSFRSIQSPAVKSSGSEAMETWGRAGNKKEKKIAGYLEERMSESPQD